MKVREGLTKPSEPDNVDAYMNLKHPLAGVAKAVREIILKTVKDYFDFVGSRGGGGSGTELSFHAAQIAAQRGGAMMTGKGCQTKEMASAIFHCSYTAPQEFSTADVVVRTEGQPGSKVCCGGPLGHVSAYLTEQW
jgi:hypothetical protein